MHYQHGIQVVTDAIVASTGDHAANLAATKKLMHALFLNVLLAHLRDGKLEEAEVWAEQAMGTHHLGLGDVESAKAYYRRGLARRERGNVAGARENLRQARTLAPTDH